MEVSVKTNDFAQVLRLVQSVTERKATIPALGVFLLTADANVWRSPERTSNLPACVIVPPP